MFWDFLEEAERNLRGSAGILRIALVVVGAFVTFRIVRFFTKQFRRLSTTESDAPTTGQRRARLDTLGAILDNLARVGLIVITVVMVLSELGLNVGPLIAGAGIAGLAIGFGAQSLVKDFFAGFFIIFENQFAIGDEVTISNHTGTVERMTLRTTTLRDTSGNLHIVPNGRIDTVTVVSPEWARVNVDVTLPFDEDLSRALDVANEVSRRFAEANPEIVDDGSTSIGVHDVGQRGALLRMSLKVTHGKHPSIGRDFRRDLLLALQENGVRLSPLREE